MHTFNDYLKYIELQEADNPGFVQGLRQGYTQAYQAATANDVQGLDAQTLEKYRAAAEPAIQKASEIAGQIKSGLAKIGLSPTVAATLIAAGLTGGLGAIPVAALTYFADKHITHAAGALFDKGVQMLGGQAPTHAHESSFHAYYLRRLQEDSINEVSMGQVGTMIGKAAGYVHGYFSKYSKYLMDALTKSAKQLYDYASKNKVAIAKAAFLTAIGLLIGSGIGSAYKAVTNPDTINAISTAITGANLGSADDVKNLVSAFTGGAQGVVKAADLSAAKIGSKFAKNLTHTSGAELGSYATSGAYTGLSAAEA